MMGLHRDEHEITGEQELPPPCEWTHCYRAGTVVFRFYEKDRQEEIYCAHHKADRLYEYMAQKKRILEMVSRDYVGLMEIKL